MNGVFIFIIILLVVIIPLIITVIIIHFRRSKKGVCGILYDPNFNPEICTDDTTETTCTQTLKNGYKIDNTKCKYFSDEDFLHKIDKIYYINLEHRTDRNKQIIEEIKKIDPNLEKTERINAIKHEKGAIGCAMSHLKALQKAIDNNYKNVIIFEDDFEIIIDKEFINDNFNHLLDNIDYNICLLSYSLLNKKFFDNKLSEVLDAQTTAGYIIHENFFHTLKEVWGKSVEKLHQGKPENQFAIDQNWKKLQKPGNKFFLFNRKIGRQRPSYSDIEKTTVNYGV